MVVRRHRRLSDGLSMRNHLGVNRPKGRKGRELVGYRPVDDVTDFVPGLQDESPPTVTFSPGLQRTIPALATFRCH